LSAVFSSVFTGCWRHPPKASDKLKRKIPLESARDDSMLNNMVNDLEMDMDMEKSKTSSRSAVSKVIELQICVCGWSKLTAVRV